jgi:cytochrome b
MSEPAATRRVWDLPVRVVHWLLVIGIAGSYATHKLGVAYFKYHLWCGYLVVVLAAFRILWGSSARARALRELPARTARHGAYLVRAVARRRARTPGHNPLGGWMVIFLLLFLLAQGITGLFANDEIFNTGPLYGYISDA